MPETISLTLYTFDELSDEAKEKARDWWRGRSAEYFCADEYRESLKGFCEHFGINHMNVDWSASTCSYSYAFIREGSREQYDYPAEEVQERFADVWTEQGCPFTGCTTDESLLDHMRKCFATDEHGVRRPEWRGARAWELFNACLSAWVKAFVDEMEHEGSDEYIDDFLEANEYTFLENGERFVNILART